MSSPHAVTAGADVQQHMLLQQHLCTCFPMLLIKVNIKVAPVLSRRNMAPQLLYRSQLLIRLLGNACHGFAWDYTVQPFITCIAINLSNHSSQNQPSHYNLVTGGAMAACAHADGGWVTQRAVSNIHLSA